MCIGLCYILFNNNICSKYLPMHIGTFIVSPNTGLDQTFYRVSKDCLFTSMWYTKTGDT